MLRPPAEPRAPSQHACVRACARVCTLCVHGRWRAWAQGTRVLQQGHWPRLLLALQGPEASAGPGEARAPRSPRVQGGPVGGGRHPAQASCTPQPLCPCHLVSLWTPKPHVQGAARLLWFPAVVLSWAVAASCSHRERVAP